MKGAVCVIDLPGLSRELLQHVPAGSRLGDWLARQHLAALVPPWPAVTSPVQATLTTGRPPAEHGIIANGIAPFRWAPDQRLVDPSNFAAYRRQVSFWEQSNQLLQAPRFWQDPSSKSRYKTAMLFFQNALPGFSGTPKPAADVVITPKPEHGPGGKLTSLLWTDPQDLGATLQEQFGPFPLMNYWGPMAGIASSEWIAKAAAWVWTRHTPKLQLVYVPHLDYDLQRFGPDSPQAAKAVVDVTHALEPLLEAVLFEGSLILLSEYSMRPVDTCIQPNRLFAAAGMLVTRDTADGRVVDYGRSRAFAMVDHQVAHVFLRDAGEQEQVMRVLASMPLEQQRGSMRIDHPRAGDLQLQAAESAWFDYRWWDAPEQAPSFATLVDIHRKPGYDPLELFFDAATRAVSQDPARVRGSHGRSETSDGVVAWSPVSERPERVEAANVRWLIHEALR